MMMLWVLCLLIGSITSTPVRRDKGLDSGAPAASGLMLLPPYFGYWRGGVSSDPGSSSSLPSLPNPSSDKSPVLLAPHDALSSTGPGSYSSLSMAGGSAYDGGYASFRDERYNSPEVSTYGAAYAVSPFSGYDSGAPGGSYGGYASSGGGYASSGSGYVGDASYGYAVAPRDEDWSSGSATSYGPGDEAPEPVFSDVSDLEPVSSFSSRSSYQRGRAVFAQTRYIPGEPAPHVMPQSRLSSKTSNHKSPANAPTKGSF